MLSVYVCHAICCVLSWTVNISDYLQMVIEWDVCENSALPCIDQLCMFLFLFCWQESRLMNRTFVGIIQFFYVHHSINKSKYLVRYGSEIRTNPYCVICITNIMSSRKLKWRVLPWNNKINDRNRCCYPESTFITGMIC